MMKIVYFMAAVCLCQLAAGNVRRDAAAAEVPEPPTLSDLWKATEDILVGIQAKFLEVTGFNSNQEFVDHVSEQSKSYASKVEDVVSRLGEELKKGAAAADEATKPIIQQIIQEVETLKTNNPELAANGEKFKATLDTVLKETKELTSKLAENGKEWSTQAESLAKELYETTKTAASNLATEIGKHGTPTAAANS